MFLSRLINQKSIEMKRNRDRRRFLRMKIRQRSKRLRLCKFRKMMQRRRQLFMCLIMNFSTRTEIDIYGLNIVGQICIRDLINWTPQDWYKNVRMSQQTFNHVCDQLAPIIQKQTTKLRIHVPVGK
jgi:hypothetical protein